MKIMTFGSCMTSITAEHIKAQFGAKYLCGIHHNRSDAFLYYHVKMTHPMIQLEKLENWLKPLEKHGDAPKQFLRNQYPDYIGNLSSNESSRFRKLKFIDWIEKEIIDVILLDNFMDISAKLMYSTDYSEHDKSPLFINPQFYENEAEILQKFQFGEFLSAQESAKNWLEIYYWFQSKQPTAKIFFLCFPYCTSKGSNERYWRARDFYNHLLSLSKDSDLHVVPPPDVEPSLTAGDDWYHLHNHIYAALAGYVFFVTAAGLPSVGQPYQIRPD